MLRNFANEFCLFLIGVACILITISGCGWERNDNGITSPGQDVSSKGQGRKSETEKSSKQVRHGTLVLAPVRTTDIPFRYWIYVDGAPVIRHRTTDSPDYSFSSWISRDGFEVRVKGNGKLITLATIPLSKTVEQEANRRIEEHLVSRKVAAGHHEVLILQEILFVASDATEVSQFPASPDSFPFTVTRLSVQVPPKGEVRPSIELETQLRIKKKTKSLGGTVEIWENDVEDIEHYVNLTATRLNKDTIINTIATNPPTTDEPFVPIDLPNKYGGTLPLDGAQVRLLLDYTRRYFAKGSWVFRQSTPTFSSGSILRADISSKRKQELIDEERSKRQRLERRFKEIKKVYESNSRLHQRLYWIPDELDEIDPLVN